jgi:light-regulated signal transduction histidine kinase (bacteriophytochrome)
MGGLIDDLLRLSQVTRAKLKLKRVDLSGMAQAVAASLQGERSGRSVEWAIEGGMTITADAELMRILMQNLLQNAWKFTGKTEKAAIRVGTLERDGRKVCFVADNGVGFDMAYADRLFGAFQRLHHTEDFPGTGIGLAIVQRVIHRHNGEIWAQAKEGQGATFFFTIGDLGNDPSRQQDNLAG